MSRNSTVPSDRIAKRRQAPSRAVESGGDAASLLQLRNELDGLIERALPLTAAESRHLRWLLASATPDAARLIGRLDAILDSPVDVDASVLRWFRLELASLETNAAMHNTATPLQGLLAQLKSTSRTLQSQTRRFSPPSAVLQAGPDCRVAGAGAVAGEDASDRRPSVAKKVRGLHVRQGGHDFVLPIEFVHRALPAGPGPLPTVFGRSVAHVCGEFCDVVELADHFSLQRGHSTPGILLVVSASNRRVAIAVDEVVGVVEVPVRPLKGVLPGSGASVDVACFETGDLALVPDVSRLGC